MGLGPAVISIPIDTSMTNTQHQGAAPTSNPQVSVVRLCKIIIRSCICVTKTEATLLLAVKEPQMEVGTEQVVDAGFTYPVLLTPSAK